MARFTNGWVKLHRKLIDSEWSQVLDINSKGLLLELLLMANYKKSRALIGSTLVTLEPGQILTTMKELTTRLQASRFIVESRINLLCQLGTITKKTSNAGTIITICKYEQYQSMESESPTTDSQTDSQTDLQTDSQTDSQHIKELKKQRNKEIKKGYAPARDPDPLEVDQFLDAYNAAMKKTYGRHPPKISNLRRLAGQIIAEVGLTRSIALAGQFCASNRDYFVKRSHSLDVMLADLAFLDMWVPKTEGQKNE